MVDVTDFAAVVAAKQAAETAPRYDAGGQVLLWDLLAGQVQNLAGLAAQLAGKVAALEQNRANDAARIGLLNTQVRLLLDLIRQANGSRTDAD